MRAQGRTNQRMQQRAMERIQESRQGERAEQTLDQVLESVIENRYNRQELIEGWNQDKLKNAKVVVAGSGVLADYVAISLAALGFGEIEIYGSDNTDRIESAEKMENNDYSYGFIFPETNEEVSKAGIIADFANKINPTVDAYGLNLNLSRDKNLSVMKKPDIIIDATNDSASKKELIDYSARNKCLFISVSSAENIGKMGVFNPNNPNNKKKGEEVEKLLRNIVFYDMNSKEQNPITGMAVSALAVDEARKYIMPIRNEKVIDDLVVHSFYSEKRFDNKREIEIKKNEEAGNDVLKNDVLKHKNVLMIGAGALGNFMGLGLAMAGIEKLIIFDKDKVESTNLNRQPFFYNSVGRSKTPALITELKKVNPKVDYKGIEEFIDLNYDDFFEKNKIDLIVDCVDNDKTRALLNYYSIKYEIPLISSGTSHNSGHVNVSVPGITACLNCQREIDKYALEAKQRTQESHSCIYAPQASVITSNMAIAGIALGEAIRVLNPEKYGEPVSYELKYMSEDEYRVGALPVAKRKCECYKDKKAIKKWPEKMKHLYEKPVR
ncbi:ThiF family adenylyltransferase [Candidatus Woesearchaeota archaeon]|nr:ThiF family adenylyltransferase [Candidatus Woesearchaeota archaeon]